MIDWRMLFMSAAGRSSRGPFWIAVAALFVVAALYDAVIGGAPHLLTFWFVYPALIASGACVLSKRLHDRGRSGWWAALVLLAVMMTWPEARGARAVIALPVWIWAVVELGVMAGEEGANRFGPSPVNPVRSPV